MRAFVALEIDAGMRDRLREAVAALQGGIAGLRWVAAEGVHLTLRFLGQSSPGSLARLELELRRAALACPRSEARVAGLGLFPDRGSPRVLWLGVSLPPQVLDLQKACELAAVASGFAPEGRPFRSHLTLGRWRGQAPRPKLPAMDLGVTSLEALVLFRSDLRPQGALYTPLGSFALGVP